MRGRRGPSNKELKEAACGVNDRLEFIKSHAKYMHSSPIPGGMSISETNFYMRQSPFLISVIGMNGSLIKSVYIQSV